MSTRSLFVTTVCLIAGITLLSGGQTDAIQADKAPAQSETTIDVAIGTARLDIKVGGIEFTYAKIEFSQVSGGNTKVRLKVAGSNDTDQDHDAQVQATLIAANDQPLSASTKKREIEEGEHNKELTFDFTVTPQQLTAGLKCKLLLSYLP